LPDKLKYLKFGLKFNQSIDLIPNSVSALHLNSNYNTEITVWSSSLKELGLFASNDIINNIPNCIEVLQIYFEYYDVYNKNIDNIPSSVKKIIIDSPSKIKFISKIPFGCTVVDIHNNIIK
jgi:hypothetical protein